jgi:beta-lactam-binding protein with PASTA domain/predicted Ser/Thr protein kinase
VAVTDPLIDTLFDGRYRIERKLGAGGMANVYLAEDQELGRRVAIKILNDRHANDDQFVARFRQEAKNAAALSQHPNIVAIFDRGEAEGTYYIAMEYLEGRTLKELIVSRGPAPPNVAIEYTRQILSALRFAHRHGIVHRDIKPHNVLVDSEGRVKVTDFGIARAGTSQMTEAGSIVGTAQYLSPEQARGGDVDPRSDLYSLGIVLYELLTGETPFDGDTPVEIAMKHLSTAPRPPSALRPELPPELDKVVLRALAKDPEDRYQSAEEMEADLERVARGAPVAAATEDSATRVMRIPEAAAAAPTTITRGARPAYAPVYEDVYEEPRRRPVWPWLAALLFVLAAAAGGWYVYNQLSSPSAVEVHVENYVTMHRADAEKKVEAIGLKPKVHKEASDTFQQGLVFKQDPHEGDLVAKGSTVDIWVSTGKPKVKVPDVVGATQDDATKQLTDAGLVPDVHTVPGGEAGKVTAEPDAGKMLVKGSKVWLNVASGPKPVVVPTVVGESITQATNDLQALGFVVNPHFVDDQHPANQVIEENPKAGSKEPKGSTIDLKVSNGPPQANVPDVTGETQDQAVQDLKGQGFDNVQTQPVDVVDPSQDGVVQAQDPQGNTQAPTSTTVTLQVGHFVGGDTTTP